MIKRSPLITTIEPQIVTYDNSFLISDNKIACFKYDSNTQQFKRNISEGQITTLGSKYPYFIRNGQIDYKEFNIGGYITAISDIVYDLPESINILDSLNKNDICDVIELTDESDNKKFYLEINNGIFKLKQIDGSSVYDLYEISNETFPILRDLNGKDYISLVLQDDNTTVTTEKSEVYTNNTEKAYNFMPKTKLLFGKDNELLYNQFNKTKNIIEQYDYIYEREYREKILEFLYKDDIKIYKTLTEGCYAVKLTDINLSPVPELSNLIYKFSANAVEVTDFNITNLYNKNIISPNLFTNPKNNVQRKKVTKLFLKNNNGLYELYIKKSSLKIRKIEN